MYADEYCATGKALDLVLCCLHRSEPIGFVLSTLYGVYFVRQLSRISVIHINLRIILCTIPVQYSTLSGTRVLYRIVTENDLLPEPWIFIVRALIDFVHRLALNTCCLCILTIGVERALAVIYRKDYEKRNAKIGTRLVISVMILGTMNSMVNSVLDLIDLFAGSNTYGLPYLDRHPVISFYFISSASTFCIVGSSLTFVLSRIVKKISRKESKVDLSTRYQSMENSDTVQTLLPTIVGYTVFCSFCELFSAYVIYRDQDTCGVGTSCSEFFVEMSYISINCYHYLFLTWISLKFKKLNRLIKNDIQRMLNVKQDNPYTISRDIDRHSPVDQGYSYFQQLKAEWQVK
ncbi:unnamed protein product [Bursaphelenchus xylophilus]|uniref:(pine wood nematode) hypothetical protein n=1 Tax=Bursaphelenchus xylophilus TaxID=6326 RepID=A0A1I7S3V4_BURXY|nr:unnamed protein product [Bursaphelenchus xylophilus]CAG9116525.1 unnamed protein product [Bursaphelenchus xylophilus]